MQCVPFDAHMQTFYPKSEKPMSSSDSDSDFFSSSSAAPSSAAPAPPEPPAEPPPTPPDGTEAIFSAPAAMISSIDLPEQAEMTAFS